MKTFIFSVSLLLIALMVSATKANAQVRITNSMPCNLVCSVDFGPPCGVVSLVVPAGQTFTLGGPLCGTSPITISAGSLTIFAPGWTDALGMECGTNATLSGNSTTAIIQP